MVNRRTCTNMEERNGSRLMGAQQTAKRDAIVRSTCSMRLASSRITPKSHRKYLSLSTTHKLAKIS